MANLGIRFWSAAVFVFFSSAFAASAEKRALVIGNAQYTLLAPLSNTIADAEAYAEAFQDIGFSVTLHTDLGLDDTLDAIDDFIDTILPGDEAVFVFSGHGWSDGQVNYLVPTDAPIHGSDRKLMRASLALRNGFDGVLDDLENAGVSLSVAIVDACRNNPFKPEPGRKSLGMTRGLAPVTAYPGSLVVFSAGEGQEALDRLPHDGKDQKLSVFTRTFLPHLKQGIYLEDAITLAQVETAKLALSAGGHLQHPAYYDQTLGNTCLSEQCRTQDVVDTNSTCDRLLNVATASNSCYAFSAYLDACQSHSLAAVGRKFVAENCSASSQARLAVEEEPGLLDVLDPGVPVPSNPEDSLVVQACDASATHRWHQDIQSGLAKASGIEFEDIEPETAILICKRSVELYPDHIRSHTALGRAYLVDGAYDLALPHIKRASEGGDPAAMGSFAWMHREGNGVDKDVDASIALYKSAANRGFAPAQFASGLLYLRGKGVKKNHRTAVSYFQHAADQGYPPGEFQMGQAYRLGRGIQADAAVAATWYTRASDQGHVVAKRHLGTMYENGQGLAKDAETAAKLYLGVLRKGGDWPLNRCATCWDRETGRAMQGLLAEIGVYRGAIDGIMDDETKKSMRAIWGSEK